MATDAKRQRADDYNFASAIKRARHAATYGDALRTCAQHLDEHAFERRAYMQALEAQNESLHTAGGASPDTDNDNDTVFVHAQRYAMRTEEREQCCEEVEYAHTLPSPLSDSESGVDDVETDTDEDTGTCDGPCRCTPLSLDTIDRIGFYRTRKREWRLVHIRREYLTRSKRKCKLEFQQYMHNNSLMSTDIERAKLPTYVFMLMYRSAPHVLSEQRPAAQRTYGYTFPYDGHKPSHEFVPFTELRGCNTLRAWVHANHDVHYTVDLRQKLYYNSITVTWLYAVGDAASSPVETITPRDLTRRFEVAGVPIYVIVIGAPVRIVRAKPPHRLVHLAQENTALRVGDGYYKLAARLASARSNAIVLCFRACFVPSDMMQKYKLYYVDP